MTKHSHTRRLMRSRAAQSVNTLDVVLATTATTTRLKMRNGVVENSSRGWQGRHQGGGMDLCVWLHFVCDL